jgi:hypothetical protein
MSGMRVLSILLVMTYLVSLSGCARKENKSATQSSAHSQTSAPGAPEHSSQSPKAGSTVTATAGGTTLKDLFTLWEAGQKDAAVRQFLSMQWSDSSVYRDMPVLMLSEQEYRSLPPDEAKQILDEAMKLTGRLRMLMFHVASVGDGLASSGNTEIAMQHFDAIRQYGQALSRAERIEVIRNHGKAAVTYAEKKLSAMKK